MNGLWDDLEFQRLRLGPPPRACRVCGCTDDDACVTAAGACAWAEADLCTACRDLRAAGFAR